VTRIVNQTTSIARCKKNRSNPLPRKCGYPELFILSREFLQDKFSIPRKHIELKGETAVVHQASKKQWKRASCHTFRGT
jgi:hypothetical protein